MYKRQEKQYGIFTNYIAGKYQFKEIQFIVDTEFPYEGVVRIRFEKCPENFRLQCYLPEHTDVNKIRVQVNGEGQEIQLKQQMLAIVVPGPCELILELPLQLGISDALHSAAKKTCWYGVLQLGCDAKDSFRLDDLSKWEYNENRTFTFQDHALYPLNQSIYLTREELMERKTKILF